jgi:hypothetical protein
MTDLPISTAKAFLEDWARDRYENASTDEVLDMITNLAKLVDKEFAEVSGDAERQLEQDFEKNLNKLEKQHGDPSQLCQEYREAVQDTRRRRLALWSVLVGGIKVILASQELSSAGLDGLYTAMVDRARSQPGVTAFDIQRTSKISPVKDLWNRARIIAALDLYPGQKDTIIRRASPMVKMTKKSVLKMVENFSDGREPRADLSNLVKLAKNLPEVALDDLLR